MPRPSSWIRSVSSASSMKRSGSSSPSRGWCQRASASTAQLRPLPSSTSGWKCGRMSPDSMAALQLADERVPRDLGVVHAGREDRAARPPAGLGGVHREVGVAQQLAGRATPPSWRARRRCSRAPARAASPRAPARPASRARARPPAPPRRPSAHARAGPRTRRRRGARRGRPRAARRAAARRPPRAARPPPHGRACR